jgi:ankyrin repeat protein
MMHDDPCVASAHQFGEQWLRTSLSKGSNLPPSFLCATVFPTMNKRERLENEDGGRHVFSRVEERSDGDHEGVEEVVAAQLPDDEAEDVVPDEEGAEEEAEVPGNQRWITKVLPFLDMLESEDVSVEALLNFIRDDGTEGGLLFVDTNGDNHRVFAHCASYLSAEMMINFFDKLIEQYPEMPSKVGEYGSTLLQMAVMGRAPVEVIRSLIELNRLAVEVEGPLDELPIHVACSWHAECHPETVRLLVGADPDGSSLLASAGMDGQLPLHMACKLVALDNPKILQTIRFLIKECPEALNEPDSNDKTPIMVAIERVDRKRITPQVLQLLLDMIKESPASVRVETHDVVHISLGGEASKPFTMVTTALEEASFRCPNKELFSALIEADRGAVEVRGEEERLPVHTALCDLPDKLRSFGGKETIDAIQFLVENSDPGALYARDDDGRTPFMVAMNAIFDDTHVVFEPARLAPECLQFLKGMFQRAPGSVRGRFKRRVGFAGHYATTTALETACNCIPDIGLIRPMIDEWAAALFLSLRGTLEDLPHAIASTVINEARIMFLALIEVVLHETTKGVVSDEIRERVRQILEPLIVDVDGLLNRGSLAVVRAIQEAVRGHAFSELRSKVLNDDDLLQLLHDNVSLQELITGVYRMNKVGRITEDSHNSDEDKPADGYDELAEEPSAESDGRWPDDDVTAGSNDHRTLIHEVGELSRCGGDMPNSAERQVRVLEASKGDLSCLFLHLRDSSNVLVRPGDVSDQIGDDEGVGVPQKNVCSSEEHNDVASNDRLIAVLGQLAAVQATLVAALQRVEPVEKKKLVANGQALLSDACLALRDSQSAPSGRTEAVSSSNYGHRPS